MPRVKPATKIVSRKQWRYLKFLLDGVEGTALTEVDGYDRGELRAMLEATDYDSLPEKSGDPSAPPRGKHGRVMIACACGCGTLFESVGRQHKYAAPSHRGKALKAAPKAASKPARKEWATILGMSFLVDPALDHYESREVSCR
jgi:hypothetical protein